MELIKKITFTGVASYCLCVNNISFLICKLFIILWSILYNAFIYNCFTNCFKYRLVEQEVHLENKQQQTINMFTDISD